MRNRRAGRLRAALLGSAFVLALAPLQAAAQDRIAVVVGNQDYEVITDLGNARNDAARMADMLRELGFAVFDGYDVTRQGFEDLMRASILNADEGSEIVFFYAGHGIQIGRRNYLLPTDVAFESIYDLPVESVTLDRVIDVLSARGTVHVSIIDACRDNPFPDTVLAGNLDASLFETKSGFDVFQTPINSLVAFSTAPGMVAWDGEPGGNSPYTAAILDAMSTAPKTDVQSMFANVRQAVYAKTDGKQVPWESSTLVRPFHFVTAEAVPEPVPETVAADAPALALAPVTDTLAPITQSVEESATDSVETVVGQAAADLPAAVSLTMEYDRAIDLGDALAAALGTDTLPAFSVADAPSSGFVSTVSGGLTYRPTLIERRPEGDTMVMRDTFSLHIAGREDAPLSVSLDMPVNACDIRAGDALDPGGVGFFLLPNELDPDAALAACEAALAAAPTNPRFIYQLGRAKQALADYEGAFALFEQAVSAGHVRALNATARLLTSRQVDRDLFDVPEDRIRAFALLEDGAAAADPFATHLLGQFLLRDGETEAERQRGFELLDRAAELGHTYSMNELGIYFLTKDNEFFLPERGMRYLEASAAREDIYGYHNLGFVALFALNGGEPDYPTAFEWFEKAALGGHPGSPSALGRMIVRDQVSGQGPAEALRWYDMGLARGDAWGGVNGAGIVLREEAPGTVPEALVRLAKARHLPSEDAVERAIEMLEGRDARDMGRAIQLLLNELGENVTVDGAIGPQTRAAIERRAAEAGLPIPPGDLAEQLSTLGKVYWAENPVRSDVF